MKDKNTQMWIPLYVDKWIFGSTRIELDPAERSVFIDLMAFGAKDNGFIRANEITPYPHTQLAGLLNIPIGLLDSTISKCLKFGKIEEPIAGIYKLCNWDKFQLSEDYKYRISTGKRTIPGAPVRHFSDSCPKKSEKPGPIEEKRIEEKIIHTTTAPDKLVADVVDKSLPVNWENCRSDHQRFIAYYVAKEMPELYKNATQAQANGLFKRYGRAASEVLSVSGDIDTARAAFDLGRAYFVQKGLSWNLSTLSKNIGEFVNSVITNKRSIK